MLKKYFDSAIQRLSPQGRAVLALIALVFLWGYNWVVMKVAVQYAAPFDYAALRLFLGGICLLAVLVWLGKPILPKEIPGTFLSGSLQLGGFYGLSTWAIVNGGAGKTAVLNYAMPFWVLLLAWLVLGERLRRLQWLSVVIALAGLLFILMPFSFNDALFSKGLALLSSVSWAVGIIISKRLQQKTSLDLLSYTTWQMLFGCIPLVLITLFISSPPITWSLPFIAALFYSVVPGNAIAWLLWFYALSRLSAGSAGLGTLATPVAGVLAAWIQLGEQPTLFEAAGMVLIVCALGVNTMQALKDRGDEGRRTRGRKTKDVGRKTRDEERGARDESEVGRQKKDEAEVEKEIKMG
ncbi:MAG: EamA family transporter [Desulfobacterales bacterium]|nr:EamA family transporter [Desulfobacterales bacterium]